MLQFPRWKVDLIGDGKVVRTTYETATTSAAAIAKAKRNLGSGFVTNMRIRFKATRADDESSRKHATKKTPPAQLQREIDAALSRRKPHRFASGDPNNDDYLRFLDDVNDPPRTDLIRTHKDDLIREMDKPARRRAHATRTDGGVDQFWGFFEEELVNSAAKNPGDYALGPDEPPEVYARRVRDKFQSGAEASGLGHINLGTPTWKRVARRLGIAKFSQKALKDVYAAHGGKI